MWRILVKQKGERYETGDYVLEKIKDLEKIVPYLFPKIEGRWKIVLIGMTVKENAMAYKELDIPEYVDVISYMPKDSAIKLITQFPELEYVKKSSKELYSEIIKQLPKTITPKAMKEVFRRFHGNAEKIAEIMPEIVEHSGDQHDITIADVDAVVPILDIVYAKDVLYSFLFHSNNLISKRGHYLSKCKYGKPELLLQKLIQDLGRDYAYYAIRKQLRNLTKEKIKYMHNEEYKEKAVEYIDTYTLSELLFSFEYYGSAALEVLLYNIERRKQDDSIFKGKVITNY